MGRKKGMTHLLDQMRTILLKEKLAWNHLVALAFLGVAAFFAFAFKAPGSGA
jgi:hypothetical protein